MLGLELVVVLSLAVLLCNSLGPRWGVAPPVLLLITGVLLGFVPELRQAHLPPETVLLLFLPALLYWESLTTSLREIRNNLRGIVLMSTLLVIITAWAVATAAHTLGLPWGPAWVLGAAISPTDATGVAALARMLPRRNVTVLRAESLINDGTALVIYGLAVGITVGEEHFSVPHVSMLFLLAYLGGAAAGALTAWLALRARGLFKDPTLGNVVMILIPFTAYLLAELIEVSGVLAAVVAGLVMSQAGPRMSGAAPMRRQADAFWSLATFLLNGALFLLIGLEAQTTVRSLSGSDLTDALTMVAIVTATLIIIRLAFLFAAAYLIRLIDRRPQQRLRRVSNRARVVSTLAGFRGAVSLAVALSVPTALDSGESFPERDQIVFVTSGVIMVTLLMQGLLLPAVVRWAHLPTDTSVDEELLLAETRATEGALAALPDLAAETGAAPPVVDRLRAEYETHLAVLYAGRAEVDDDSVLQHAEDYTTLRLALIAHKRATVIGLRDEHKIDDTVLRQIQAKLDSDEVRLTHH
ncbi:Na+/H+ antiporter [Streptomyces sp. SID7760]|uniref:Na+/H+ antiporter n=1 Tax=Streptomyces sp. NPDC013099 TaxID=3156687 RepID=UPI00139DC394|nr:Na+/H+ antiporter [Streptomyces sp. SID7760]